MGELTPPGLDGYTYVAYLGGGGFADVYLYQQQLPDRQVAIKVLRATVDDDEAHRQFNAEANLMARVSTHPNIVTIHAAAVSRDRRPYLVMEYYPFPHFGDRIRSGPLPVHEVLAVGVKISAAVQTAHRASIIHRDIKPANILTSEFNEPGLTDFGISAAQTATTTDESLGFSPPYAPPEILADLHPGNAQSDIYSLAATLWALLAGYSPFELPDRRLSRSEIISRGLSNHVPPLPRSDVPRSLEFALRQALEKDPARRPSSARSFGMTLRAVEEECGYQPTPLNLLHEASSSGPSVLDAPEMQGDKTKKGRGQVVNPDGVTTSGPGLSRVSGPAITGVPSLGAFAAAAKSLPQAVPMQRLAFTPELDETRTVKASPPLAGAAASGQGTEPAKRTMPLWTRAVAGSALVIVLVVIGFVAFGSAGSNSRPTAATTAELDGGALVTMPPVVDAVSGVNVAKNGGVIHFTWTPSKIPDVRYRVTRVDDGGGTPPTSTIVSIPSFDVTDAAAESRPCISIDAFIPGVAEAPSAPTKCTG